MIENLCLSVNFCTKKIETLFLDYVKRLELFTSIDNIRILFFSRKFNGFVCLYEEIEMSKYFLLKDVCRL